MCAGGVGGKDGEGEVHGSEAGASDSRDILSARTTKLNRFLCSLPSHSMDAAITRGEPGPEMNIGAVEIRTGRSTPGGSSPEGGRDGAFSIPWS